MVTHDDDEDRAHGHPVLRRVGSWLGTLLLLAAIGAIGAAAWVVRSGGWQAHPVLSGSMEPLLPTGSVAILRQVPTDDLRVGDVITFGEPGHPEQLVTHRIAAITEKDGRLLYRTKGDANRTDDPWQVTLRGQQSYRLSAHVPYVGYAVAWMRQPDTRLWFYGAAALVGLWALLRLFLPERSTRSAGRQRAAWSTPEERPQTGIQA